MADIVCPLKWKSCQCSCSSCLSDFKFHSCHRHYFAISITSLSTAFISGETWIGPLKEMICKYWSLWLSSNCSWEYSPYFNASSVRPSTGTSSGLAQSGQQSAFAWITHLLHAPRRFTVCFNRSYVNNARDSSEGIQDCKSMTLLTR
jgi:hypothetical protein